MNTTAPGTENHRVKTALRVIEIIEIFSREQKPLALSELARELNAPASSCLALVRTLLSLGYLYETSRRQGYYPTGRLLAMAQRITKADPVLERLSPSLRELCAITGETVVLGKLTSLNTVVYLDVLPSENPFIMLPWPESKRKFTPTRWARRCSRRWMNRRSWHCWTR